MHIDQKHNYNTIIQQYEKDNLLHIAIAAGCFCLVFNGCKKDGLHSLSTNDSLNTDRINVLIKKATLSTMIKSSASYMAVDKNGTVYFMNYDNTIYKISGGTTNTFYIPTSADTSHNTIMGLSVDLTGNNFL